METRRRHEILARQSTLSMVPEYNPKATSGQPIESARTKCGQIKFSGGRLWFAKVPMGYNGVYDASKACTWEPLTSKMSAPYLKAILEGDSTIRNSLTSTTSKFQKEQKIAKLSLRCIRIWYSKWKWLPNAAKRKKRNDFASKPEHSGHCKEDGGEAAPVG